MEKGDELLSRSEALGFASVYLGLGRMDGFSITARPLQHQFLWDSCANEGVCVFLLVFRRLWVLFHTTAGCIRATGPLLTFAGYRARKALSPQAPLLPHP